MKNALVKTVKKIGNTIYNELSLDNHDLKNNNSDNIFDSIIGYEDIKKIFEKAIVAPHFVHLLLTGAPGSAKTLFLLECFQKLNNSYFTDNNSTGAGIVDYLFEHPNTKYLLIDEFEKLSKNDQNVLLNVMETGILTSTKIKRTKSMKLNLKIFATSNNIELISKPIRSRFLRLHLKEYDEKTFHQIVIGLLTKEYKKSGGLAATISTKVWNKMKSNDIRDAIKVAKLSTSIEDVDSIVNTILRYRSQTNKLELLTN